jgi:flagellar biosynthetic protein FliO
LETVSFFPSLIKMIFALAIVLGMMLGAMFLVRNFLQQTTPAMNSGSMIKVLASRYLGPKNSILVVDVAGQIIVIGLSGQQMTLLTTITDEKALLQLRSIQNYPETQELPLMRLISQFKGKMNEMAGRFKK